MRRGADNGGSTMYGHVATSGVAPTRGKPTIDPKGAQTGLSLVYGRDPPTITFQDAAGTALGEMLTVDGDRFVINARIVDDGAVNDAYVFVGSQKVFYQRLDSKGPTDVMVKHTVKLEPGVNVITVVAREDDEFAQREALTVFSKAGDPFAKKKRRR